MKALLIYPQYPDTFWSFKHALKFTRKKAAFPPLGLLTVAAMLPVEWKKKLVDVNVAKLSDKDIEWSDIVLISAMIVQKDSAQKIINRCKTQGKTVVAGGPLFTTSYKKFTGVDHFILGEAEIVLPLFLKDFAKGAAKQHYLAKERSKLSQTPTPLWSLINFSDYSTMAVQFSRGCPHDCEFCNISFLDGRIPRTKTTCQFIKEIQSLYDAGWKGPIFIVDDNFIGNKRKAKNMLRALIKWQKEHKYPPFKFLTEASVNLAKDVELMNLMSRANFYKVFLGLETPHIGSLKETGKIQNLVDLFSAVNKIHSHGMQVMGGFIVGFDNDPADIFDKQIKFIQKIGVVTAMVGILNAIPGTKLWDRLARENRLIADSTGDNTDGSLNFKPLMDKEKLIAGYKKILATIYSPKDYYERAYVFIKNYRPSVKSRLQLTDFKAFIRSIWRIGIFSKANFFYWKLLIKTCLTNIRALSIAVELAIYGLHFKKVAKKVIDR